MMKKNKELVNIKSHNYIEQLYNNHIIYKWNDKRFCERMFTFVIWEYCD